MLTIYKVLALILKFYFPHVLFNYFQVDVLVISYEDQPAQIFGKQLHLLALILDVSDHYLRILWILIILLVTFFDGINMLQRKLYLSSIFLQLGLHSNPRSLNKSLFSLKALAKLRLTIFFSRLLTSVNC